MRDSVDPKIFSEFPGYIRGVVVATNVDNGGYHPTLEQLFAEAQASARARLNTGQLIDHPQINSWRYAFTKVGVKVSQYRPAIESLGRRVVKGQPLPYINSVVAAFNCVSVKYLLPSGADDLAHVQGDLRLTFATGAEPFTPFNSSVVEYPDPGEVVYTDGVKVLCRRWTWRQGDETKLTERTASVAINLDALAPLGIEDVTRAAGELSALIRRFCGGETEFFLLHRTQPSVEFTL